MRNNLFNKMTNVLLMAMIIVCLLGIVGFGAMVLGFVIKGTISVWQSI